MSRQIIISILSRSESSPRRVKFCDSFLSRLRGFTFRKNIRNDEGLILVEKKDSRLDTSIHMFFVWSDLAVFWINASHVVVDKVIAKSWHPYYASKQPARFVVELHPTQIEAFQVGDKLDFRDD